MEEMQGEQQEGPATVLAKQVGQGLQKLSEMLAQHGGSEEEMGQMKQIMDLYINLVESKLGGAEAQAPDAEGPVPADQGSIPMDQGAKGAAMGPQSRN